ncbi:MAG TPA: hypothetical protein VIG33_18190 [Pseudobdellovibrionaceae bacterium]|jgi:hypothetical protein
MINSAIACSLIFSGLAFAQPLPLHFKQVDLSENISQLLRSNADHCWTYNKDHRVLKDLNYYLDAEGVISGDPHLGNTTVIPVRTKEGVEELRLVNVDFDDGGHGPFALEFARFATVAKASSKEIKIKDMSKAYLKGLNGQQMPMPKRIAQALSLDLKKYESLRAEYVEDKMKEGHFKYKKGEIEKWNGHPNSLEVAPFFRGSKVIDVAQRPAERGGSLASLRLWVLLLDEAGAYRIKELKQTQDTALSEYSPQASLQERIEALHKTYWEDLDQSVYDVADIQGISFWVREKKVEILSYKDKQEEEEGHIYLANLMGLTQAKQTAGPAYATKISEDPDRFKKAVKEYVHTYLGIAKDTMD